MKNLHTTGVVRPDEHGVGIVIELRSDGPGTAPSTELRVIMAPERAEEIARAILELAKDFVSDEELSRSDEELSRQSPAP